MLFDSLPAPVRDSVYVAIGLPVVAVQEAQAQLEPRLAPVRERATTLRKRLGDLVPRFELAPLEHIGDRLDHRVKAVEERVNELEDRLETVFDQFENQLPEGAREVVHQARDAARDARTQLRSLVTRAA